MKEGMFQFQVQVPSMKAESTVTAYMNHEKEMKLELESEIKLMDVTSEQKIDMKCGNLIVHLVFLSKSRFQFEKHA